MKSIIKIKLPVLVTVDDYHAFGTLADVLSILSGVKVKYIELPYDDEFGYYRGVFYTGKMPTKDEIKKMKLIDLKL